MIRSLFELYIFFRDLPDPLKENRRQTCLVTNHLHIFKKEMAYVCRGLLSDPPGVAMYRQVGHYRKTGLPKYRCIRTTSPLEAHFLHYSRSLHPTAKASSPRTLHMRTNYFDFVWTLRAAEKAGLMTPIHHSQPWLVDLLCVMG